MTGSILKNKKAIKTADVVRMRFTSLKAGDNEGCDSRKTSALFSNCQSDQVF